MFKIHSEMKTKKNVQNSKYIVEAKKLAHSS